MNPDLKIPPELEYIMGACRSVSNHNYRDAISLMKEGLRETSGLSKTLDIDLFIALLRTLVVDLERQAEKHNLGISETSRDVD
jgi:hypothetical protein